MTGRMGVLAVLAVGMMLGACRKREPEPPPPVQTTPMVTRDTAAENAAARAAEEERRRAADAAAGAEASRAAAATLAEMVFFEYDQSDIRADMQGVLDRKAAVLRANPSVTLRIDGHADERGSVEYNLALSLRRANAAREYLTGAGIDVSRLEVAAFGEERPLDAGTDESAYARNRRAEFQITRGGDSLVPAR
ncbi:MAG: OmpA family protein [Gemmatimonadota bacterium]